MFDSDPGASEIVVPINVRVGEPEQSFSDDTYQYSLPAFTDLEGDDITLTVDVLSLPDDVVTPSSDKTTFEFKTLFQLSDASTFGEETDLSNVADTDIISAAGLEASYTIPVKLEDSEGSTSYILTIKFEVSNFAYEEELSVPDPEGEAEGEENEEGSSSEEDSTGSAASPGRIPGKDTPFEFQKGNSTWKPDYKNETEEEKIYIALPRIKLQSIDNFGSVMVTFSEELKISEYTSE